MGIIGTRSLTTPLLGIEDLVERAKVRVKNGIIAYEALQKVRADPQDKAARKTFDAKWRDLGYALLLKRFTPDIGKATPADIDKAAQSTVPQVAPLYWRSEEQPSELQSLMRISYA